MTLEEKPDPYEYEFQERLAILLESEQYHISHARNKARKEINERCKINRPCAPVKTLDQ
jgi:hypothetical protein